MRVLIVHAHPEPMSLEKLKSYSGIGFAVALLTPYGMSA
jgi:hypothetical protein